MISDTELAVLELVQSDTFPQVALALKDLKEVLKKVLITGAIALWLLFGPLMDSAIAQTADANPVNSGIQHGC